MFAVDVLEKENEKQTRKKTSNHNSKTAAPDSPSSLACLSASLTHCCAAESLLPLRRAGAPRLFTPPAGGGEERGVAALECHRRKHKRNSISHEDRVATGDTPAKQLLPPPPPCLNLRLSRGVARGECRDHPATPACFCCAPSLRRPTLHVCSGAFFCARLSLNSSLQSASIKARQEVGGWVGGETDI